MKKRIRNSINIILVILSILIMLLVSYYEKNFSDVSFEQMLFHLTVPLEGSNDSILKEILILSKQYIIPLVVLLTMLITYQSNLFNHECYITIKFKIIKFIRQFIIYVKDTRNIILFINISIFLYLIITGLNTIGFYDYLYNYCHSTTFYEDYYIDPKEVNITFPEEKQNLIYIYLESIESTYANLDETISYKHNLIPNLTKLANKNISFSNTEEIGGAYVSETASWTIGAMVAQSSGVPIKVPIQGNELRITKKFLPGIYSLGEILEKEGYNQLIMFGSDASFGGRDKYFLQHGNYDIYDVNSAKKEKKISKKYNENWGFEDKKLYEYAKEKITELSKESKPFNFTILTADTHFPYGYTDKKYKWDYNLNNFGNAIVYSDKNISDFVQWIKEQDFYKNTTIILVGDHLVMGNYFYPENYKGDRRVYNCIINSRVSTNNTTNREFSTFDMYPTTLAAIGAKIEGEKLGFGTNLFSKEQTLTELIGNEMLDEELSKNSKYYNKYILK